MKSEINIPELYFSQSLSSFKENGFVQFIYDRFGPVSPLAGRYGLGTSFNLDGSTIFWQRDYRGKLRGAKIYLYDPVIGKLIKRAPLASIAFVSSVFKNSELDYQNCFYLEHLIKWDGKPVVITETEKRAVIANIRQKDFVFVAAGDLSELIVSGRINRVLKHFKAKKFFYEPEMMNITGWGQIIKEFPSLSPIPTSVCT